MSWRSHGSREVAGSEAAAGHGKVRMWKHVEHSPSTWGGRGNSCHLLGLAGDTHPAMHAQEAPPRPPQERSSDFSPCRLWNESETPCRGTGALPQLGLHGWGLGQ